MFWRFPEGKQEFVAFLEFTNASLQNFCSAANRFVNFYLGKVFLISFWQLLDIFLTT